MCPIARAKACGNPLLAIGEIGTLEISSSNLTTQPTISVLVPTWKRPESLTRCIRALKRQTRVPDQIVVTVRSDDADTWNVMGSLLSEIGDLLNVVATPAVNLRDAMNLGLACTTGSLVALTDDDAEPRADWLERLEAGFTSDRVGGVGGRDWQPNERWNEETVGRISWYGRVVGNHHLGCGPARSVELLKGVNCCFRGDILRRIGFDRRLRGRGNVSHWEIALCVSFLKPGYQLVFDPSIAVDHHVGRRHDGDINARGGFEPRSHVDSVFNETAALLDYLTLPGKISFALWAFFVGTRAMPGLLQVPRLYLLRRKPIQECIQRFHRTMIGRLQAFWAHQAAPEGARKAPNLAFD